MSCGKIGSLSSISRSQRGAGPFATRLGLVVQHHKLECHVGKWDYCVQGQGHIGHREGSECRLMFVWMIFSESYNILVLNLVW